MRPGGRCGRRVAAHLFVFDGSGALRSVCSIEHCPETPAMLTCWECLWMSMSNL